MFADSDFPRWLQRRLERPLPGWSAQRELAPQLSYGRHAGPAPHDARPAAVVALLCWSDDAGWILPVTLRPSHLSAHAGQVCLPGGSIEADESSEEAALRELNEELGIDDSVSTVLGPLSPVYLYNSNFSVTPWIAWAHDDCKFIPDPREVDEVIELPLAELLNAERRGKMTIQRNCVRFAAPYFEYRAHRIWGATALILAELAQVMAEYRGEVSNT